MTKTKINDARVLIADEGAYITNGSNYSQKVYLGKFADEDDWRDASAVEKSEYDRQQKEQELDEIDAERAMEILFGEEEP